MHMKNKYVHTLLHTNIAYPTSNNINANITLGFFVCVCFFFFLFFFLFCFVLQILSLPTHPHQAMGKDVVKTTEFYGKLQNHNYISMKNPRD